MAKDFVTPEQYQRGVGKIKDYVDNLSVIAPLDSTSNDEYVKVNLEDLELTKTYIVPKGRYIGILVTKNDGTKQSVLVVSNTCFSIYVVSGNKGTANRIFYYTTNFGSYKVNVTSNIDNNGKYIIKQEAFVLGADNLIEYNPQTPYSPATKKYVDDKSPFKSITSTADNTITINELQTDNLYELNGPFKMFPSSESVSLSGLFIFENIDDNTKALRKINNNGNITTTSYVLNVNAKTYTINKTQEIKYLTPESNCIYLENVGSGIYSTVALSARVNKSNNTSVALGVAGIKYLAITKSSYNGDTIWSISVLGSIISDSKLTLKSDGTVIAKYYQYQTNENVLTKTNTTEYTPTEDYHPATKKYVDDTVPHVVSTKVLATITANTISANNAKQFNIQAVIDKNKRYYIEFLGSKKLCSLLISNINNKHFIISHFDNYNIRAYNKSSYMILNIKKIDSTLTDNFTDLIIYEEEVKYLDSKYLETDLILQNSISLGRVGKIGNGSSAIGNYVESSGNYSHAEGYNTIASGESSHVEGKSTTSSGDSSHAEGYNTIASGESSHAEGTGTTSSGDSSHAEGSNATSSGESSHAEGMYAQATGNYSHAEGYNTIASGESSHAEGNNTKASSQYQHVQGKHNIEDKNGKYAHIVGNGDSKNKSNAHTLDWNGNAWYAGKVTQEGTPTDDKDLTNKKYVDDKVAGIVNSAPETLDTLQELATALGNDPNFATTVATQIGKKVDKVDGMSLTHNDLTNELKANYDAAYTYSQAKHSYNDLTDKPTIPSIDGLATTKYVDDKAVNKYTQLKDTPIEVFPYTEKLNSITNTTQKICAVNAADLKGNTTYMCPDNCGRLGIKYTKLDNTEIAFFLSYNTNNLIIQTGYKDDKKIEILIDGIVYTVTFKTATEEPNAVKTVRYLTDKNTVEFTPTKDYQPSTKKYVDDTIVFKKLSSIVELNSDKKIINVEKFEDNKVYYFINDINEGTTTIIPILLYKGGEKNSIIMIYPNDRFITMSYSVSKNEFFSFSDMQSVKYNLVDKTREYNTSRSVTKKVSAEQVLTKTNTTEFTPTSDYHPTTKKYVDDKVVGLATESYVDSKTSMENVIYEGNGTGADVISDYWTGCPVVSGNGCWVINKQIEFDSSKPNPYYLLCDNTLYSPEKSTFDKTNSAWIYPKVPNRGTIFICNKYNNENKLVLPWDDVGNPQKIKLYTKTELAKAMFSGDYNDLSNKPTIPSIKGLATEEYVNNKVTDTATSLTNDPDIYLNKDKYQYVTGVNTVNNMIWLPSTDLPAFLKIHLYVTNCKMQCVFDTPIKWKISQKPNEGTFKIVTDNIYEFILTYINGSWIGEIVTYSDTEYTPTNDADITTKKYVDDRLNNLNIKTVTQSEYDSLSTKEPNTLYLITD